MQRNKVDSYQIYANSLVNKKNIVKLAAFTKAQRKTEQNDSVIAFAGWDLRKEILPHVIVKNMSFVVLKSNLAISIKITSGCDLMF